jgi:hypothetical protein
MIGRGLVISQSLARSILSLILGPFSYLIPTYYKDTGCMVLVYRVGSGHPITRIIFHLTHCTHDLLYWTHLSYR